MNRQLYYKEKITMALDVEKVEMIIMEADEKLKKSTEVFLSDLTQVRAEEPIRTYSIKSRSIITERCRL